MWPTIYSQEERKVYDIPSILLKNRIILLSEEVNPATSTSIIGQLLYLDSEAPGEDINLYINSPGGSISDGFAIYDCINRIKSKVNTYSIGMSASMGAFLLCSGTGKRYAYPNSTIMIHQPLGGVSGQASDIQIVANRILDLRKKLYSIMSKNTHGKTSFEDMALACDRDKYLTPEEALKMGLIDEII